MKRTWWILVSGVISAFVAYEIHLLHSPRVHAFIALHQPLIEHIKNIAANSDNRTPLEKSNDDLLFKKEKILRIQLEHRHPYSTLSIYDTLMSLPQPIEQTKIRISSIFSHQALLHVSVRSGDGAVIDAIDYSEAMTDGSGQSGQLHILFSTP